VENPRQSTAETPTATAVDGGAVGQTLTTAGDVLWNMADKPQSGTIFGVPYNFERPSVGRLLASYWQPGKGMLVEKPFGIGYTLNLASWRSWIVLLVAGALLYHERGGDEAVETGDEDEPVEVIVD